MALTIKKVPFRRWPVTVVQRECADDGAVVEVASRFIGHFRPIDETEVQAIRDEVFGVGSDAELKEAAERRTLAEHAALEARFFARLMCGWEAVENECGEPLSYSAEALTALAVGPDGPAIRRGLGAAVFELRMGVLPIKNAVTSPAPGPTPGADEAATS